MDKDSFVFHRDFMDELWDDAEERLKWYDRIFCYALNNEEPEITDRNERKAWGNIKSHIDADRLLWEKRVNNLKQYRAKKYGHTESEENTPSRSEENKSDTEKNSATSSDCVSVFESVSESEFVSESESVSVFESEFEREVDTSRPVPSKKGFVRPSQDEIKAYVSEKGYTFDPGAFFNFYESNGWKVGKNAMKNWKAACKTWQQREKDNPSRPKLKDHGEDFSTWGEVEW